MPPHIEAPLPRRPRPAITGIAQFLDHLAAPGDPEYEPPPPESCPPDPRLFLNPELAWQCRVDTHTGIERKVYLAQERARQHQAALEEAAASWDPNKDPNVEGDPYKTLFVSRLSYDVSERKLRREFEEFGPVKRIRLVHDKNSGKPRGYAFIEFEHKSDMKEAYKAADGRRIEGRRCLVDVERGRTVPQWRPRRLGGGKGGESRAARMPKNQRLLFQRTILDKALGLDAGAAPGEVEGGGDGELELERRGGGHRMEKERERDGGRDRERERDRSRRREDGDRHRSSRPGPPERDGYYASSRDRERDRDRGDDRRRDRKRDRSDRYDDRHYDDRNYGSYNAVPPPATGGYGGYGGSGGYGGGAGRYGAPVDEGGYGGGDAGRAPYREEYGQQAQQDEPEEGEYPIADEPYAKRPREQGEY